MSLDACHLKGEIGGQLLCAIGKYGNDDMIPIAYAVAEAETKASWEWFIGLLVDDVYVGSGEGCGWTIMSDRQKVMFTIFPVSFLLLLLLLLLLFFFFFFNFYCFIGFQNFIDRIICICTGTWSRSRSFVATC
jgi:hypothetical protein